MKASADYWKYRFAHEQAAHRATKKELAAERRAHARALAFWSRAWRKLATWTHQFS